MGAQQTTRNWRLLTALISGLTTTCDGSRVLVCLHTLNACRLRAQAGRGAVWQSTLARILSDELDENGSTIERAQPEAAALVAQRFDLEKLSRFEGSGRAVAVGA
eukprot:349093-Rhodomonas_salina.1